MANKTLLFTLFALCLVAMSLAAGDCPSSTKVQTCTPKCLHDSECSAIGGKCCPNLCNGRSCVQPNLLSNSGSRDTSPFSTGSGGGSYCGNVKCSSFEKCESDRSTKRPKCVRS
ncbi:waprin-Thr1-like [Musca vetustissima]|uniref:waprin-Thr1-like n=1 Tax=Musca vetustissima TaxID=27455 RepID=UPI002AB6624B|nr:waprin-Thr1-like [Musca vetustissima]